MNSYCGLLLLISLSLLPVAFGSPLNELLPRPKELRAVADAALSCEGLPSGGYALSVPRSRVEPLEMGMEEAMRFMLTAGVTGLHEPHAPPPAPPAPPVEEPACGQ